MPSRARSCGGVFATRASLRLLLLAVAAGTAAAAAPPYSRVNPADLGVVVIKRGLEQAPAPDRWVSPEGAIDADGSLARPTNAWWSNFVLGQGPSELENANGFGIP